MFSFFFSYCIKIHVTLTVVTTSERTDGRRESRPHSSFHPVKTQLYLLNIYLPLLPRPASLETTVRFSVSVTQTTLSTSQEGDPQRLWFCGRRTSLSPVSSGPSVSWHMPGFLPVGGWVTFLCLYAPRFPYPFICWTARFVPCVAVVNDDVTGTGARTPPGGPAFGSSPYVCRSGIAGSRAVSLFFAAAAPFCTPTSNSAHEGARVSMSLPALAAFCYFDSSHPISCEVVSCSFDLHGPGG